MIICVTGTFPIYDRYGKTGKTEYVVSHGIDSETDRSVVLPCVHPRELGAILKSGIGWVIKTEDTVR